MVYFNLCKSSFHFSQYFVHSAYLNTRIYSDLFGSVAMWMDQVITTSPVAAFSLLLY